MESSIDPSAGADRKTDPVAAAAGCSGKRPYLRWAVPDRDRLCRPRGRAARRLQPARFPALLHAGPRDPEGLSAGACRRDPRRRRDLYSRPGSTDLGRQPDRDPRVGADPHSLVRTSHRRRGGDRVGLQHLPPKRALSASTTLQPTSCPLRTSVARQQLPHTAKAPAKNSLQAMTCSLDLDTPEASPDSPPSARCLFSPGPLSRHPMPSEPGFAATSCLDTPVALQPPLGSARTRAPTAPRSFVCRSPPAAPARNAPAARTSRSCPKP
jgi:hypothetical protein